MLMFLASGCTAALIVAGGAGAVGGYSLSRDTVEGVVGKGSDELWDAAHTVVSIMGSSNEERRKTGDIDATIAGAHVTVNVLAVNLTTSKLRVKARKYFLPRVGLAQEIFNKIMHQLEE